MSERKWRRGLGGVDTCYAKGGRGAKVHYVGVYVPSLTESTELAASTYTLCGVRAGEPANLPLLGRECSTCYNRHPVWGRGR